MTELSNKMDAVAKDGYRAGMVRHIAQGQKRINDKEPILADINSEMKHLTLNALTELYEHAMFLRKKEQVFIPEAPACPRIDEQEVLTENKIGMCGRCYDEGINVFPANCAEKPEKLAGQPLGQYHCPDCGAMVLAGLSHPDLCQKCLDRNHPGFDKPTGGG